MFENTAIYQEVLNNLYEGVYFLDTDRTISFWNQGAERITGYVAPEVMGRPCADDILCHVDQEGTSLCQEDCPAARTLEDGQAREADVFLLHRNGHRVPVRIRVAPILDAAGRIIGAVEVFADNSSPETLRQRIDLLEKLTGLDPLTQLPNRRRLEEEIQARLAETKRYGLTFGILFADSETRRRGPLPQQGRGPQPGDDRLRHGAGAGCPRPHRTPGGDGAGPCKEAR